ncbi:DUF4221 family protein [Mongoliibacter ruber]|uniref:Uncharacterized protein DUF4221 n=1 Tax=Mongoliibacter ruber TaxID=1750599 RepID=A0A2T0WN55_9BACT|nr:DUF4221 family protein [Mongoliibacter ruber]PRY88133.1 uncharacterized protein DUF4221 [Mongoliibacter ruber]
MIKRSFYLLCVGVFIFSCTNSEKGIKETPTKTFQLADETIQLDLPDGWGHFGHKLFSANDNIYLFNYSMNSIAVYDLSNFDLQSVTTFDKEGPDGVGSSIGDIQVDERGDYWIASQLEEIFHVSPEAKVINRYKLNTDELSERGVSAMTFSFIQEGKKIYHPSLPQVFKWTELSPEEIAAMPNLVAYDLEEGVYEDLNDFDLGFLGDNLNKLIIPSIAYGKNGEILINHNFRDLYVYKNGSVEQFYAGISTFPNDPPVSSVDMFEDMMEVMRIISFSDMYESVSFFPKQNVYVRKAKFAESPEDGMDADGQFLQSTWGLVFLDEDFNHLGELVLPESMANGNYLFDTEKGFWYSTDHPNNPEVDEEVLQFRLIKVDN